MRFANIEILWLLVSVPVLIAAYIVYTLRQRRRIAAFGDPALMAELMPNASRVRPAVKFGILMVSLTLLVFAAARPQLGIRQTEERQRGIEAMIALDISNSMLAEDVAPSRLDRAKQMVSKLVDNMTNDRVGLVIFAGDAFTQLPITGDYASAKMFLNDISPDLIRVQGTDIGAALERCIAGFDEEQSDAARVILLITDAEDNEDRALEVAKVAKAAGIRLMVIGVGTPEGTTIPVPGTNRYLKDRQGNLVVTKLNEDICQQLAQTGEGIYVRCDNSNTAQRAIIKELSTLKTAEFETMAYKDYNEQFASFALVALALLIAEFFIFSRKNKLITKLDMFGEKSLCILALVAFSTSAFAQRSSRDIRSGNSLYRDSVYDQAEVDYRRALDQDANSYAAQYNLGNALYRQNDSAKYESALTAFQRAARLMDEEHANNPARYAKAMYNAGNCYKQLGRLPEAAEAYKEALRKNPKDDEARKNLAKIMKMQQQQQQQQQSQSQQQQQQQQQQEQQQQQQEQQEQQMDQATAEQILQALEQEENRPQPQQGQKRQLEKNW